MTGEHWGVVVEQFALRAVAGTTPVGPGHPGRSSDARMVPFGSPRGPAQFPSPVTHF
jgi:hypothetical protein